MAILENHVMCLIMKAKLLLLFLGAILILASCAKDPVDVIVPDNQAPDYSGVPTLKVRNYIIRLYIDILGREPLEAEMDRDLEDLKSGGLTTTVRNQLISKLQSSTDLVQGDSTYKIAYYKRLYDLTKVRLLDGASEDEILGRAGLIKQSIKADSLSGDSASVQLLREELLKVYRVIWAEAEYREGDIDIREVYKRMLNNDVYDLINMNSVNFVNACFDDLYGRFPTQDEFDVSFDIIEYNHTGIIMGQSCDNKTDYVEILTQSREFHEGLIKWVYSGLLARNANSAEVYDEMKTFYDDPDLPKLMRKILVTEEYANFF